MVAWWAEPQAGKGSAVKACGAASSSWPPVLSKTGRVQRCGAGWEGEQADAARKGYYRQVNANADADPQLLS